jgi:protocatechuate 3,4-dioxygenase, alpha subunit
MTLPATPSQTVGPYFSIGLTKLITTNLAGPGVVGQKITIRGRVLDADGKPIDDAVIETWQANSYGKYAHPEDTQDKPLEGGFHGFGRASTDDNGAFSLTTIKPGPVPGPHGTLQAPHIVAAISMRGLLKHLVSRIYFPDEPGNAEDVILNLVEPSRRTTLIAKNLLGQEGVLEWNVVCAGESETVFFDY